MKGKRWDELAEGWGKIVKAPPEPTPAAEGELLPPESPRQRSATVEVEGATPGEKLGNVANEVIEKMTEQLRYGDSRESREAGLVLLSAATKAGVLKPPEAPAAPPPPELSPEERQARLLASLQDPDAELLAALAATGWVRT